MNEETFFKKAEEDAKKSPEELRKLEKGILKLFKKGEYKVGNKETGGISPLEHFKYLKYLVEGSIEGEKDTRELERLRELSKKTKLVIKIMEGKEIFTLDDIGIFEGYLKPEPKPKSKSKKSGKRMIEKDGQFKIIEK